MFGPEIIGFILAISAFAAVGGVLKTARDIDSWKYIARFEDLPIRIEAMMPQQEAVNALKRALDTYAVVSSAEANRNRCVSATWASVDSQSMVG